MSPLSVTFKGTREGLRVSFGQAPWRDLMSELTMHLERPGAQSFFRGARVLLETGGHSIAVNELEELIALLSKHEMNLQTLLDDPQAQSRLEAMRPPAPPPPESIISGNGRSPGSDPNMVQHPLEGDGHTRTETTRPALIGLPVAPRPFSTPVRPPADAGDTHPIRPVLEPRPFSTPSRPLVDAGPDAHPTRPMLEPWPSPAAARPTVDAAPSRFPDRPPAEPRPSPMPARPTIDAAPSRLPERPPAEPRPSPAAARPTVDPSPIRFPERPPADARPSLAAARPTVDAAPSPAVARTPILPVNTALAPSEEPTPTYSPVNGPINPFLVPPQPVMIHRTVRSGQKVEHSGTIVIVGDVNAGSEVIAGGDVLVWGRLRGVVHAGAGGDDNAIVGALFLAPTQLRIGNLIARAPDEKRSRQAPAEVARIRGGQIIVEPWGNAQ